MADTPPKYVDDVTCRELWAETVQALNGAPGTVKIEFCTYHWSPYAPVVIDRVSPVARIALPLWAATELRDQLNRAIEGQHQQAALAAAPPASSAKN